MADSFFGDVGNAIADVTGSIGQAISDAGTGISNFLAGGVGTSPNRLISAFRSQGIPSGAEQNYTSAPVTAQFKQSWDKTKVNVLPYSTVLSTVQDVVDFLLGYGEYLKDQGFIFDNFNNQLGAITNWETSAKEFLFWTTQNWSTGQDKWKEWTPSQHITYGEIVRYNGEYYRSNQDTFESRILDF